MTAIQEEVLEAILQQLKFGFDHQKKIFNNILDLFDSSEVDEKWLKKTIAKQYKTYIQQSLGWTYPTDFDKLANAFDQLCQQKIIALHKAGYTRQDGESDIGHVFCELKEKNVESLGFCFYTIQDLERAVDPEQAHLMLAFGHFNGEDRYNDDEEGMVMIGKQIVKVLQENGLQTEWAEDPDRKINIVNINWQKIPKLQNYDLYRCIDMMLNIS